MPIRSVWSRALSGLILAAAAWTFSPAGPTPAAEPAKPAKVVERQAPERYCQINKDLVDRALNAIAEMEESIQAVQEGQSAAGRTTGAKRIVLGWKAGRQFDMYAVELRLRGEPVVTLLAARRAQAQKKLDELANQLWPEYPKATSAAWNRMEKKIVAAKRKAEKHLADKEGLRAFQAMLECWTAYVEYCFFHRVNGSELTDCAQFRQDFDRVVTEVVRLYQEELRDLFRKRYEQELKARAMAFDKVAGEAATLAGKLAADDRKVVWDKKEMTFAELAVAWARLHGLMGVNLRQCLALALALDAAGAAGRTSAGGGMAGDLMREYSTAIDRLDKAIVDLYRVGLAREAQSALADARTAYLRLLTAMVQTLGAAWPGAKPLAAAVDELADRDPELKKQVDRYRALTAPLLYWQGEVAAAAAKHHLAGGPVVDLKFPPAETGPTGGPSPGAPPGPPAVAGVDVAPPASDPQRIADSCKGQLVAVPHMRVVKDADGHDVLQSAWFGRSLFTAPMDAGLAARLQAARERLQADLTTGPSASLLTAEASLAVGTAVAGPFPLVVGRVEKVELVPVTYALAHMSDAATVAGKVAVSAPSSLLEDRFYVFHLKPVCIQAAAFAVTP